MVYLPLIAEMHSEPNQTSMIELFEEMVNYRGPLSNFVKGSTLYV